MLWETLWNRAGGGFADVFTSDQLGLQMALLDRDGQGVVLLDRDGQGTDGCCREVRIYSVAMLTGY